MIEFNKPPFIGTELEYIRQAAEENNKLCGDGPFTKKCSAWMQDNFNVKHAMLTTSCTHALEMAAYLSEMPSFCAEQKSSTWISVRIR